MLDKRQQIMAAAVTCFAEKGFHATSIQEIADSLGMAKGSLYFYFKSKEDLLVSIFDSLFEGIMAKLTAVLENPSASPRERIANHIQASYAQIAEHRDFILMFFRERAEITQDSQKMIGTLKAKTLNGLRACIVQCYGEESAPYAFDAATMLQAMLDGYLGYMIIDGVGFDSGKLSEYLLDRLDDLMAGMIAKKPEPILDARELEAFIRDNGWCARKPKDDMRSEVQLIREKVGAMKLERAAAREMEEALLMIEQEIDRKEPQPVVLKGMIALLKGFKLPAIRKHVSALESSVKQL